MVEHRRPIKLLPGVNQTDTLTKFFAATVDHLFQPESVEFISAYIGTKPAYYDPQTDFYVGEPTKSRQDYQLPATAVSTNPNSGKITNIMFYHDFVNLLQFHGANVQNESRLFEQEYYCWTPPIDLDKILNYTQYYWLPSGPAPILLLSQTDLNRDAVGHPQYTYQGVWQLTSTGAIQQGELALSTGLVIIPTQDADTALNGLSWIVNDVGRDIQLISLPVFTQPSWDERGWDTYAWDGDSTVDIKDYTTIARAKTPTNQWSSNNRWYHEQILSISGTSALDLYQARAARPIVEFQSDLRLYNAGWRGRPPVTLVSTDDPYFLRTVVGSTPGSANAIVDGFTLNDGDTVLVTGDLDPLVNNQVYLVGGIADYGVITLTEVGGPPVLGDTLQSLYGQQWEGVQWWYNGSAWVVGQQRKAIYGSEPVVYDAPLFMLYDSDGNALNDPSIYPSSTFAGNRIFGYQRDSLVETALDVGYDTVLGFGPVTDQFGSYVFNNYLVTDSYTYLYNTTVTTIPGFAFYRNDSDLGSEFNDSWYKSPEPSRQYIYNDFTVAVSTASFTIDQQPDPNPGFLPSIYVTQIRDQQATLLTLGVDYTVSFNVVTLVTAAQVGDRIVIRSWSRGVPVANLGYYELPLNLTANPNNEQVTSISQSQYLQQFETIIGNQPGFQGQVLGSNNWRDTAQIRGLGFSILQHRAPMIKPMILSSGNVTVGINSVQSNTDPITAIQFAGREYVRFYNRLLNSLQTLWRNGFGANQSPQDWLNVAYMQINLGKTLSSPFANSGPDGAQGRYTYAQSTAPTYVPPTATRLGMAPAYQPMAYILDARLWIQAHDGAQMIMAGTDDVDLGTIADGLTETTSPLLLTNPVAAAWLQFELDMFTNMPTQYQDAQATLALDIRKYEPGKWRQGSYTADEFLGIQYPMFNRWAISAQVDWRANTTYDPNDPFTWNYHNQTDQQGQPVPGYYKGIYRWFYDTDRPHTHPWEMLGFGQQPPWWTSEYGPAPYTNGNTFMWEDLSLGLIRQGPRAGIDPTWARPGLLSSIPVDAQGNLLPPLLAGTVTSLPDATNAAAAWQFGDGAPVESVWIYSNDYNFDIAAYSYLMKPAQFVEYNWDTLRQIDAFPDQVNDQWIYTDTYDRRPNKELYVHRENPSSIVSNVVVPNETTLTYYGSGGLQHWISEYLIGQNLNVTQYLGNIVRGTNVQLAHQCGGFVASNLYLTADSFGQIGYTSQIIPSENVSVYLYRSASIKTSFYTGVVVTQLRTGYQVIGYDGVNQYFNTIPSNIYGAKTTVIIGNERVVWYKQGIDWAQQVPYGTVFATKQEVFDFLVGLQRYQELQGWVFDTFNPDGNYTYDWIQSGKEFLFWSQGNWANGNFIALSPLANSAKFVQQFGMVQFVSGLVSGTYPVLDKTGNVIDGQNLEVLRFDDTININPLNTQSLYGLRLFATTLESVILIDNITSFNDVVYDPLYNLQQPRLKLYAYRTNDWDGRVDAPGYFLYQDGTNNQWDLVPNFEKTANDFRKYYNIDQPKNFTTVDPVTGNLMLSGTTLATTDVADISKLAKHQIGYQNRPYLSNLLLEESTEFQFYQGFIRQKGTKSAIDKLLRNNAIVPVDSTFEYFEEFAFRDSRYGASSLNTGLDFIVPQNQYINNPQQITVFGTQSSDRELDGVITLIPHDPLIVVPPPSYDNRTNALFPLRDTALPDFNTDLPNAGYVLVGETTYTVTNSAVLSTLWESQQSANVSLQDGDTIWELISDNNSWMVYQFSQANVNIANTSPSIATGLPTTINTTGNVGVQPGDLVVLSGISNITINGTWTVSAIAGDGNSFTISTSTFDIGTGGTYYVYKPIRFANVAGRDANPPFNGWADGDRAYVDQSAADPARWTVYLRANGNWIADRIANLKVNPQGMQNAKLYSALKGTVYGNLEYYDPAKGVIPGQASRYINYRSIYDPAAYNSGDSTVYPIVNSRSWGPEHVGVTWWDLSSIRYLDYEIGNTAYRWQNWGSIAPGTTVDVYEWVASPVTPANWATYVAAGNDFSQFGLSYAPSGTVLNASNPAWSQFSEYTSSSATSQTFYYFWVKNAYTLPLPQDRALTTVQIANIIAYPNSYGVVWYAAIDDRNIVVANIGQFLSGYDTVLSLSYTDIPNQQNTYTEWELVRQGDPESLPSDYYWAKLKASLIGKDGLDNIVPDAFLSELTRYGVLIRPRQSMFVDQQIASETYINLANQQLGEILLVLDVNRSTWVDYLYAAEPSPPADYTVGTISSMQALGNTIPDGSTILVLGGADTANLWVLYTYSWNGGSNQFTRTQVQAYNTPNYWTYVDWYETSLGITANTIPNYTVSDLTGRDQFAGIDGIIIKVSNTGNGSWGLYKWYLSAWITVGYQNGTIQILSSIYDGSGNTMQFGTTPFDSVTFDIYPWQEFGYIIDGLVNVILPSNQGETYNITIASVAQSAYLNTLWFAMVNYALVEQKFVDWAFKTSYITLHGFNVPLSTSQLYAPDYQDSIIAYINEVKPYHVKIREFVSGRSWFDNAAVSSTDFDNPANVNVMSNTAYSNAAWQANYQTNPELIRTLKLQLLFDRVASISTGWTSYGWQDTGWQLETGSYEPVSYGAFTRIAKYYAPGPDMIRPDDPDLIPGSDYRGIIVDGVGFTYRPGWSYSPWDNPTGWNADQQSFDDYLDIMISGGVVPVYDQYYGTGTTTIYKLSRVPQSPSSLVVWSDNLLRDYGVDFVVPSFVTAAMVSSGGSGYAVGDLLQLSAGPAVESTKFTVESVDDDGAIVSLTLTNRGYYDVWPAGPIELEYQPYAVGSGIGAVVMPTWGGDTLIFAQPPLSNAAPNIFVLYVGTTFQASPTNALDIINDGNQFVQPYVAEDHPEERYVLTVPSSLRMDVLTEARGGAPNVVMQVYQLDGVRDHFPLGAAPMDSSAVIAQIDGKILTYGLDYDFVINWATNNMVFLVPPTGDTLQIMTITTGGTGINMQTVTVVSAGSGYMPGDFITLAGGSTINQTPAIVQIIEVTAESVNIQSPGTGYAVGDILVLPQDSMISQTDTVQLTVLAISLEGGITSVALTQTGIYQYLPSSLVWLTDGQGSGAVFDISWGVYNAALQVQGAYSVHPTYPIAQASTTGSGTGATFAATYTATVAHNTFVGDGITTDFVIDVAPPNNDITKLFITENGTILQPGVNATITANGRIISISPAPASTSTVTITEFETSNYSVVFEQEIYGNTGQLSWQLTRLPYSTLPVYLSTTISTNGSVIPTPPMQVYVADGLTNTYAVNLGLINPSALQVYVGDYLLTYGVNYTLSGSTVIFDTIPIAGATVAFVLIDFAFGYSYQIDNGYIVFQSEPPLQWGISWDNFYGWAPTQGYAPNTGDIMKVVTYSEDASYGFRTVTFTGPRYPNVPGNTNNVFVLPDRTFSDSTAMVWAGSKMATLLYDYQIITVVEVPGWDITTWSYYPWNQEYAGTSAVKFVDNLVTEQGNTVTVQYMHNAEEAPAIAWRTIIDDTRTTSTVLSKTNNTLLMADVAPSAQSILVADVSVLPAPTQYTPGTVWIGYERIDYYEIVPAPTTDLPNQAYLTQLRRGTMTTPYGNVSTLYDTIFYDGDGQTTVFATSTGGILPGGNVAVFVGNSLQLDSVDAATVTAETGEVGFTSTYSIVTDPAGYPAGQYVKFDSAPPVGWKNVKLASPKREAAVTSNVSHLAGATVIAAGPTETLPGGYTWSASPEGLQYADTSLSRFLINHPAS